MDEFPAVVNVSKRLPEVSHKALHHIVTTGPPLAARFHRLDGEKREAAKVEFRQLEADGIIQRSTSPWASPLHMVQKKDGSWRPCDALCAQGAGAVWHSHLPWVLLGLCAAPKEDSGISSAEMVLGVPVQLPGELMTSPETAHRYPATASPCARFYAEVVDSPPAHLALARFV